MGGGSWVSYEVANPDRAEMSDVLLLAQGPAWVLSGVLDRAMLSYEGALTGPEGDRVGAELVGWKAKARQACEDALNGLESLVASMPETVTKYYWQPE